MTHHQDVEEMPQRRQRQILGGVRSGQVLDEAPHGAGIGAAGVGIGDLDCEKLVGGQAGGLSGAPQDGGEGLSQGAGTGNQHVHIIGREHTIER